MILVASLLSNTKKFDVDKLDCWIWGESDQIVY